jgi:hypothetical protein
MSQLALDFEPGLTARYQEWEDVLAAAVYGSRKGLNGVAADLDMSPSELTRRLNRNTDDSRPLRAQDAIRIVKSTEDYRPVYWMVERFLRDPETTRNQAIQQLSQIMPIVQALVEQSAKR